MQQENARVFIDLGGGMPLRSIAQIQNCRRTFIYKRLMDTLILADLFLIMLNLPFYLDMPSFDVTQ